MKFFGILIALLVVNVLAINKLRKNTLESEKSAPCSTQKFCWATLYQNGDFTGWSADFPEGEYTHSAMMAQGAKNDDSMSIKVRGPSTCCVAVYQSGGFNGWKAKFRPGDYNAEKFRKAGGFYDGSSIKVSNDNCKDIDDDKIQDACWATIYEHGDFNGA